MQYYPQYIHVPTTAPVQRYFADPHVPVNKYGFGSILDTAASKLGGVFGANNPDSGAGKIMGTLDKFGGKFGIGGGGIVGGVAQGLGSLAYKGISGGLNSGFGKAFSGIGSAVGGLVGKVNPLLGGAITLGSNLIGGIGNALVGTKKFDWNINAFNDDTAKRNNARFGGSNQQVADQMMNVLQTDTFGYGDMGKTGLLNKGAFEDEFNKIMRARASSNMYASAGAQNAVYNNDMDRMDNLLINQRAMGGFFDNPFSHPGSVAIAYGNEQRNLQNQEQMVQQMQQNYGIPTHQQRAFCLGGSIPYACGGKMYAEGGSMNTHGSDFTNGLMYITSGGRHEDNPYQGVPMGYDSQGVPNVVEQDEIIVPAKMLANGGSMEQQSDFVVSNRTYVSDRLAAKYPEVAGMTHAEALETLTKESRENPTDIIAQNTDKAIVKEVVQDQEEVKQQEQMQQMAVQQMMSMPQEQPMMMPQQEPLEGDAMDALGAQQEGIPMTQPQMAFGGNMYGIGGPVNVFAGGTPTRPYVPYSATVVNKPVGNQFAIDSNDIWREMMAPRIRQWVRDNIYEGQSPEERRLKMEQFNNLQQLFYDAGMTAYDPQVTRKSDAIGRLQKHANQMGINDVFTDENINKYFTNHQGRTGDVDPTFQDNIAGGFTFTRHGPWRELHDPELTNYLRGQQINFFPDAETGAYLMSPYVDGADSSATRDYLTESELEAFQNDPNGNGEVYTPSGDGTNPEEDIDDQYGSHAAGTRLYDESLRYAPIWASGIAALTDLFGITNRPDYTAGNQYANLARQNNNYIPVTYHTNGEQMIYRPYDPVMQNILNQADVAAQRRFIQGNSNGNGAMANAYGIALNRNAMKANGELGLQSRMYNDQQMGNVLQFNNGVNARNSRGIFGADAQNANNWARQNSMFASLMGESIAAHQAARDRANAARSLNLSNFVKSLGALGKENAYYNMVNTNAANLGYGLYRGNGVMYNPWRIDQ